MKKLLANYVARTAGHLYQPLPGLVSWCVLLLQVMLPLFCYCQLDNFAWGTRGIDATETNGQECKDLVAKKPYEVGYNRKHNLARTAFTCNASVSITCIASRLYCMLLLHCYAAMLLLHSGYASRCHRTQQKHHCNCPCHPLSTQQQHCCYSIALLCKSVGYTFVSAKLMATAGGLQVHETAHKQAQRLCNQVHGASSLPDSQHGHWVRDCHHHNLVLVGLHDDGYSAVPAGSPHHHFWAVPHSVATVLTPPQTPEEDAGCQNCSACSHGRTTRQEQQ